MKYIVPTKYKIKTVMNLDDLLPLTFGGYRVSDEYKGYEQFVKLFQIVAQECSQICDVYRTSKKYLYRGVRSLRATTPAIIEGEINLNRQGRDESFSPEAREITDLAYKKLGIAATRSNSIFTVNWRIGEYGPTYIIFPKNGFKFSYWAEEGGITFSTVSVLADMIVRDNRIPIPEKTQTMAERLKQYGLCQTDLRKVLGSFPDREILITGTDFYGIHVNFKRIVDRLVKGGAIAETGGTGMNLSQMFPDEQIVNQTLENRKNKKKRVYGRVSVPARQYFNK